MGRGWRVAAAALTACAVATACGTDPASEAAPGLRVTVEQSRDNENRGLLQLVLHNDGSAPVRVRRAQLRSPGWATDPPAVFDDEVRPGRRIAFPVTHGDPRCDVDGPAGSAVVLGLGDGGSVREARLPVPDDDPVLPRLHARACALQRLSRDAELSFSTGWVLEGDVARGALVLERRRGDTQMALTALQSSIVFLLQPTGALPAELGPDDRRVEVPVEVRAVRCDPHALIESKRSHTFPVFVAVGDAEPLQVPVTADEGGIVLMDAVLRQECRAQGIDLGD